MKKKEYLCKKYCPDQLCHAMEELKKKAIRGPWPREDGAGNDKSAHEIFGKHYDVYQNMHSNEEVREAVRKEQLQEYVKNHNLAVRYYQDFGWPAVEL